MSKKIQSTNAGGRKKESDPNLLKKNKITDVGGTQICQKKFKALCGKKEAKNHPIFRKNSNPPPWGGRYKIIQKNLSKFQKKKPYLHPPFLPPGHPKKRYGRSSHLSKQLRC